MKTLLLAVSMREAAGPGAANIFAVIFTFYLVVIALMMVYRRFFTTRRFIAGQANSRAAYFVSGKVRRRVGIDFILMFIACVCGILCAYVDVWFGLGALIFVHLGKKFETN